MLTRSLVRSMGKSNRVKIAVLIGILIFLSGFISLRAAENATSTVSSREELENLIRQRAEELEKVNRQIEETEKTLEQTRNTKATLQKELNNLQYTVNQLQLSIQADNLTIQKLTLEIDSLSYDLNDIELAIADKHQTIAHLLRELQRQDNTDFLYLFLKNKSLADSILETQSLQSLREQLAIDILNLSNLQKELNDKILAIRDRKSEIELRKQNSEVRKALIEEQKNTRATILSQTKNRESLYEQQLEELRKQQEEISIAISEIEERLRAEFNVSLLPLQRPGVLAWPITPVADGGIGRKTQCFGEKSRLYGGKPHNGLDIGAPIGTPVFAADDGIVMAVDNNDRSGWSKYQYGKYILLRHSNNLATLYAHLSRQLVKTGETVNRGQLIGYSGNSGYSTGPHLHLGLYWAPSIQMKSMPPAAGMVPVGVVIDPWDYLALPPCR